MLHINLIIPFLAGIISFFAPCFIPLLPIYISYLAGTSYRELVSEENKKKLRKKILINSIIYILGFTLVFVLLGATASYLSKLLISNRILLYQIGGLLIFLFGLYNLGFFENKSIGEVEFRINISHSLLKIKIIGPFLLGATFALAWTPCIGPTLGAILILAANSNTIFEGIFYLLIFSFGIAIPFFILSLIFSYSGTILIRVIPLYYYLSKIGGIFMILLGLLIFFDKYNIVYNFILQLLYSIPYYEAFQYLY